MQTLDVLNSFFLSLTFVVCNFTIQNRSRADVSCVFHWNSIVNRFTCIPDKPDQQSIYIRRNYRLKIDPVFQVIALPKKTSKPMTRQYWRRYWSIFWLIWSWFYVKLSPILSRWLQKKSTRRRHKSAERILRQRWAMIWRWHESNVDLVSRVLFHFLCCF